MCSFLQKFETFQLFRRTNFRFELILILASEKRLSYSDNDWSRLRTRNEFSLSRRGEGPLVRNRHQEGGKHWRFNKTSLVGNRRSGTGFSIRHPARIVRVIDDGRYQCFQRAAKSEKKSREWSSLLHELRDNPDKFESRRSKRAFRSKQTIYLSFREDQEDRDEKGRDAVIPPRSRIEGKKGRRVRESGEQPWEVLPPGGEAANKMKTSPRTLTFSKGTGNQVMQQAGSLRGDRWQAKTEHAFHEERQRIRTNKRKFFIFSTSSSSILLSTTSLPKYLR